MNSITAIIVAAGRGTRAGSGAPKQYRKIGQKPILQHTIESLLSHNAINKILCVIHEDDTKLYMNMVTKINDNRLSKPVHGGATGQKVYLKV